MIGNRAINVLLLLAQPDSQLVAVTHSEDPLRVLSRTCLDGLVKKLRDVVERDMLSDGAVKNHGAEQLLGEVLTPLRWDVDFVDELPWPLSRVVVDLLERSRGARVLAVEILGRDNGIRMGVGRRFGDSS
ncbi:hypothetical protein HG530_014611 [Fusarium avenaceum]|nr:hypothetical protein HG530_014611 [Fusarium avenaceum]